MLICGCGFFHKIILFCPQSCAFLLEATVLKCKLIFRILFWRISFVVHENVAYRRVSKKWRLLLTKVFVTNHLSISLTKTQRHTHWKDADWWLRFNKYFPSRIEAWYAGQEDTQRGRGIIVFGLGETLVPDYGVDSLVETVKKRAAETKYPPRFWHWRNVRLAAKDLLEQRTPGRWNWNLPSYGGNLPLPSGCHITLKDCRIEGTNWRRMEPSACINTLFSIHVTEKEHFDIGPMGKGHRENRSYIFGEGEAATFSTELLRLGRKYAKPMTDAERHILHSTYRHYYLKKFEPNYQEDFSRALVDIMRVHEPEMADELVPDILTAFSMNQQIFCKLKPLTQRLLEAIARCYV